MFEIGHMYAALNERPDIYTYLPDKNLNEIVLYFSRTCALFHMYYYACF